MIQQVAKAAGVSAATVSRAFQSPERVATATLQRILEVAELLHYTPNALARRLRTSKSNLIVVIVSDIVNPFWAEVIRGIEDAAQESGYSTLLGDTQNQIKNEVRYANLISSRQVDGGIVCLPQIPHIRTAGRVPIVNACELTNDPTISSIGIDDFDAFRRATAFLIDLGHRSIGFVGGPIGAPASIARRAGFEKAMAEAGLHLDPRFCLEGNYGPESGRRAAETIFAYGQKVTAIMCVTDLLAMGALQAIQSKGLSVPGDVSVMGFDDIVPTKFTNPPLSTVHQPRDQIGREAMHMLLDILKDEGVPPRKFLVPTHIVVRGSTAPPPSALRDRVTGVNGDG
jgi:LacI family repressor for deo operon, udp, cdd, tsx, nupC, and nupG